MEANTGLVSSPVFRVILCPFSFNNELGVTDKRIATMSSKPPGELESRYDYLNSLGQSDSLSIDEAQAKLVKLNREVSEGIEVCHKLIKDSERLRAQHALAAKASNVVNLHADDAASLLLSLDQVEALKKFVVLTNGLLDKYGERQAGKTGKKITLN
ncbi:hypothetical protein ACVBEF_10060 [Glaciimonas sp. GG7]